MRRLLFLLPALLWLAACGGGSPESPRGSAPAPQPPPAAATPPSAPPSDPRPAIVVLGDSISAGFGLDPSQAFPAVLQQDLSGYRVVNAGISGDTTAGGLSRMPSVLAEKPKVVVLELGGNDGLRGLPLAQTKDNLEQIVKQSQDAGAKVLLVGMTLPANYGPDYIRRFENIYRDLASQYDLALVDFAKSGAAGMAKYLQSDGIHPTAEGQKIVAGYVLKALKPLLR